MVQCRLCGSVPSNLPTYLPTYLSTYLPTYLPTYLSTYLSTYLPYECSKSALAKLAMVSSTMSITP